MLFFRDNIVPSFLSALEMPSFVQLIAKAIAFANTARLSICRLAVQKWSVFVTNLFYNA